MTEPSSAPIVLVHGAWHGSWCWSAVTLLLVAAGRSSTAAAANPTRVVDLDTSHSPFLSQPDRVASAILEA
jgi:pimeloyl-ACP methyl ester carboxylesterase